jgi:ribosome-binding factor A
MKRKPSGQKQRSDLCSEPGPDDGIDPRDLLRATARKKGGRKTLQLCGQVAEALNYAIAAVCNDDVLRDLTVVAVHPSPDDSRMLVTVGPSLPGPSNPAEVLAHLHQHKGKLRSEVARAIHRKKVPVLTFNVTGAPPQR